LDISNVLKPIPYNLFVSFFIEKIGTDPSSALILRLSSTLFMVIGIIFWYLFVIKREKEIIIFSILIISSGFLLVEGFYFRYYSYYFFTSTLTFLLLKSLSKQSLKNKITVSISGIILSPFFLYWFNTLQFFSYFIYIIFFDLIKKKRTKKFLAIILFIIILFIILYPENFWIIINKIKISNHLDEFLYNNQDGSSFTAKGFKLSTAIKPFYAIYQMLFGYTLMPTEYYYIIPLFISIMIGFIHLIRNIYRSNTKIIFDYLFIFIIPFFAIFYFFEPISPPGFTQLYAKHAMLFYPLPLILLIKSNKYLKNISANILLSLVLIAQIRGTAHSFNTNYIDWNKVSSDSQNFILSDHKGLIIIDDITEKIINYYKDDNEVELFNYLNYSTDSLINKINDSKKIVLLVSDYKTYSPFELDQVWHKGRSTKPDYEKLTSTLNIVNQSFDLDNSYVSYPTFLYLYNRKLSNEYNGFSSIWGQHLKDLALPIIKESGEKVISSKLIGSNKSIELKINSKIIFNLENSSSNYLYGDTVGTIECKNSIYPLIKGVNIWDIFSEFNKDSFDHNKVFHSWFHLPLISSSIRYDGSLYRHKAQIFYYDEEYCSDSVIKISNITNENIIRIWTN